MIFSGTKRLKGEGNINGFGGPGGKMVSHHRDIRDTSVNKGAHANDQQL
jgi:hypothetical protein